ncbi:hypothetical protein [Desulfosarcina alkanivorans]|uniref:hypothetical protein n=1 Tax=Desulfosarcina alkanivorans TaxID=571177 RepID=UPI0012D36904|nr:hypothetical protein [Desulfosarcina alkanivorans]
MKKIACFVNAFMGMKKVQEKRRVHFITATDRVLTGNHSAIWSTWQSPGIE